MAGAESCYQYNMCFSSKYTEQKLLLHGTKVTPILFTDLN